VALSMDEQRILAEIERRLAADDPGLASCLTTFRRPGPASVLRSPRARIIGSLFTVLLVAMVSLMVYAMIPFRAHLDQKSPPSTATAPGNTAISDAASSQPHGTQQASATTRASATASDSAVASSSQGATDRTASPTSGAGTSKPQQGKVKPTTNEAMLPEANP
jgi:cytoskeletal protein RodZ